MYVLEMTDVDLKSAIFSLRMHFAAARAHLITFSNQA